MQKYIRWIIFGVVALGLIVLIVVVGLNKDLRQKVEALLLEKFVRNKVADLRDKATAAKTKADAGKISAEQAEQVAADTEKAISEQKDGLQQGLEQRGLSADEIANRFNNLSI